MINQSSRSTKRSVAVDLRNKLLGKKVRGELASGTVNTVLISDLLDDILKSDIQENTRHVWKLVVEANCRSGLQ